MAKATQAMKSLLKDLEKKEFTDCTFVFTEGGRTKTLDAHKLVLSNVSPVLKAAFFGQLKHTGPIELPDISFNAFQALIWIVYGKHVVLRQLKVACSLYYAAQKYNIQEPLAVARAYMLANINVSTAAIIYNATILFDDLEIIQKSREALLEKTIKTTKTQNFFDTTTPLNGENVFFVSQSRKGKKLQGSIEDYIQGIQKDRYTDLEGFILDNLELIRILTTNAKKVLGLVVPETMATLTCTLDNNVKSDIGVRKFVVPHTMFCLCYLRYPENICPYCRTFNAGNQRNIEAAIYDMISRIRAILMGNPNSVELFGELININQDCRFLFG